MSNLTDKRVELTAAQTNLTELVYAGSRNFCIVSGNRGEGKSNSINATFEIFEIAHKSNRPVSGSDNNSGVNK